MKQTLTELFCTKIGWLIISLVGVVLFGALTNVYDWAVYPMFVFLAYPVTLGAIMMIYAYVINPIRNYRKNKKQ